MISLIIVPSVLVGIFALLIIFQALKRPIIYKYIPLRPKVFGYRVSTIFSNANAKLIIIPNIVIALILNDTKMILNFSNIVHSLCNENRATLYLQNFKLSFQKDCLKIIGTGEFSFSITRPNAPFSFNSKLSTITVFKKSIHFLGFKDLKVTGGSVLSFSGEVHGEACIDYKSLNLRVDKTKSKQILSQDFGYLNASSWESIPNFNLNRTPQNVLKRKYINSLLDSGKLKVCIPKASTCTFIENLAYNFCFTECFINLDKLGVSKILLIRRARNTLKITDLLTNFEIILKINGDFIYSQCSILGGMYLYLRANGVRAGTVEIMSKFIKNALLYSKLVIGIECSFPKVISINSFLYNLNRLILHGVYVDIDSLLGQINRQYLNTTQQFLLANLTISFINVFERYDLLNKTSIKELLYCEITKSLQKLTSQRYIYLKKVLPYITNEALSSDMLNMILDKKGKFSSREYEFYLNEVLGVRLSGVKLFLEPKIEARFDIEIFLKNHSIHLIKKNESRSLKIDNIRMSGVEFIDLTEYPREFTIEFI